MISVFGSSACPEACANLRRCGLTGLFVFFLCVTATVALCLCLPSSAFAYFDRGPVGISLGANTAEVAAGGQVDISVSLSPESDAQTLGCGMPTCPQSCSSSCLDENGQCRCAGADTTVYTATVRATSSDPSVAVALYDNGVLRIYGKSEGSATITLTASLRQFSDSSADVRVVVSGVAESSAAVPAVDVPEQATQATDEQPITQKLVMGRNVYAAHIGAFSESPSELISLIAGTTGEITFWSGENVFAPDYSLTFYGSQVGSGQSVAVDPALTVSYEASGVLHQPLYGHSGYVIVGFADDASFGAPGKVFVKVGETFSGSGSLGLFRYDNAAKALVRVDSPVELADGYASFTVEQGGSYVISEEDLSTVAAASSAAASTETSSGMVSETLPASSIAAVIFAIALLVAIIVLRRNGAKGSTGKEKESLDD